MSELSRRALLGGTAVVAATALLPKVSAVTAVAPKVAKPPMPSWAVGQDDQWNWKPIKARTEREAIIKWMGETNGTDGGCEEGGPFNPDCTCDECSTFHGTQAVREPSWDGHRVESGDIHWFNAGMGACCSRCSEEAFRDAGAEFVSGNYVCEGCMTLADWEIVDPERAAELREEMADV